MPVQHLNAPALRLQIDPAQLGFQSTHELSSEELSWIGQERAQTAARFGLSIDQPDYHLFVLGDIGTGRSTLLEQEMRAAAARRPVPPDLCYLHNFDAPERPRALRLPAGEGRLLRQAMLEWSKTLQQAIPKQFAEPAFKAVQEQLEQQYAKQESEAYQALGDFAQARHFTLQRDNGQLILTLMAANGESMTNTELNALSLEERQRHEQAERELRTEIMHFLEFTQPLERALSDSLNNLRLQSVKPLVERELQNIRQNFKKNIKDTRKLGTWLEQVSKNVLEHLHLFDNRLEVDEDERKAALNRVFGRYRVNLLVDNAQTHAAPVILEHNPLFRSLFGSIEYQSDNDTLVTDFSRIRAGSLHKAHGGFLLLHVRDLLSDELVWEKLRRFLRSGQLQIEEPATMYAAQTAISLEPEALHVDVKLVLIGSHEHYYALQEHDPELARHFHIKVDFADRFEANAATRHASAIFVAHVCQRLGLPHFSAAAVAALLEDSHRQAEDQTRQCATFGNTESLAIESAAVAQARGSRQVEAHDVHTALQAQRHRHDALEQQMRAAIVDGERLIALQGTRMGQLNGLTVMDLGDYRFGQPMRVTVRTVAGHEGLVNIEREVELSGPIHDKAVLILQSYLSALFGHLAPLAMNASIVFEQEYYGVEGDSASCAELYALLSSLSGLPLQQGIAVTGAISPYGEVLPIGGVNEKIEGFFAVCRDAGLDGQQGVLIPRRNQRHLMLSHEVCQAVAAGQFHIYTTDHVSEGAELLMGTAFGALGTSPLGHSGYPPDSILGRAEATLLKFRRAYGRSGPGRRR